MSAHPLLQAENAAYHYSPRSPLIFRQLNFTINQGEFVGLIGPNGTGKSTLLRLLAGISAPTLGTIRLEGRNLKEYRRRDLAQHLAFVPQDVHLNIPFTCREVVSMGRYAAQRSDLLWAGCADEVVTQALRATKTDHIADRPITQVSGGEAQRVRIAQALAQKAPTMLMDEPTAHLDIKYQIEIMDLVLRLNVMHGLTVIAAIHDLNLAAQYCNRLLILKDGHLVTQGPPETVLTEATLKEVFGVNAEIVPGPRPHRPRIFLPPGQTPWLPD